VFVRIFQASVDENRRGAAVQLLLQIFFGNAGNGHGPYCRRHSRGLSTRGRGAHGVSPRRAIPGDAIFRPVLTQLPLVRAPGRSRYGPRFGRDWLLLVRLAVVTFPFGITSPPAQRVEADNADHEHDQEYEDTVHLGGSLARRGIPRCRIWSYDSYLYRALLRTGTRRDSEIAPPSAVTIPPRAE
jgi:hypothetical protein